MADKFKVTIGMSVNKEGSPDFFDGGLVYHNMPYDKVVAVEGVFAKHAAAITEAMGPLVADLVAMGVAEIDERDGGVVEDRGPNGVIR
ncbi:MAG: hypothetical protein KDI77_17445 [Gammaproteobacteria bacterium]|nr:hypothetical protein [Gammaproteobacteria bacterium]